MRYGYARSENEEGLALQVSMLEAADVPKENIFIDMADGSRINPRLEMLITQVKENDTIVIKAIDRISRSTKIMQTALEQIAGKGAEIKFLDGNVMNGILTKTLLREGESIHRKG